MTCVRYTFTVTFLTVSALSFTVEASLSAVPHWWKFSTILLYKAKKLRKVLELYSTMLDCYVSQQSKQIVFAHLVGAEERTETENTKNERLKKKIHDTLWNSPKNVRTRSTTSTLRSHKSIQRIMNNLWKALPKNVKKMKEDRNWIGEAGQYIYEIPLFSFQF